MEVHGHATGAALLDPRPLGPLDRGLVTALKETRRTKSAATGTATALGIVLPSILLVTTGILRCRGRLAVQPWADHAAVALLGAAMTFLGMAGTPASRRQLGALWPAGTVLTEGRRVVDSGPYRLVRHPTYASGIAMGVGTALVFPIWWDGLTCLAVTLAYLVKMQHEDRFLAANLPGYAEYRTRVRHRIVPGVW